MTKVSAVASVTIRAVLVGTISDEACLGGWEEWKQFEDGRR